MLLFRQISRIKTLLHFDCDICSNPIVWYNNRSKLAAAIIIQIEYPARISAFKDLMPKTQMAANHKKHGILWFHKMLNLKQNQ
jgi:hypothetical protein